MPEDTETAKTTWKKEYSWRIYVLKMTIKIDSKHIQRCLTLGSQTQDKWLRCLVNISNQTLATRFSQPVTGSWLVYQIPYLNILQPKD